MDKWYKVFISSPYLDLIDERLKICETLLKMNCIPLSMEYFASTGDHQWSIIKRDIERCDYYVLILAGKYGTINKSGVGGAQYTGLSFTEMEYQYAVANKKPILAFLHNNCDDLPAAKVEETAAGKKKLKKFKTVVQNTVEVQFWGPGGSGELCAAISTSLHKTMEYHPASGLCSPVDLEENFKYISRENEALRLKLKQSQDREGKYKSEVASLLVEIEELYRYADRICVYTKDRDPITIEQGATALDFAFAIHPMVGLCATTIYVTAPGTSNTTRVSFDYVLHAGDTVNVISDSGRNGKPKCIHAIPQWNNHLRTSVAKYHLNNHLKDKSRE